MSHPSLRADDEVVMMSSYEVSAHSMEFKGWTKLRSPNFNVYTDASVREVRPYVRQMEMLHLIAQVMFGRKPLPREPATVILPTSSSDWRKLRSKGFFKWKVAVSSFDVFAYGNLVEYDWQRNGLRVLWASLGGLQAKWLGIEPTFVLGRGMGTFFETLTLSDDGVRIGRANPRVRVLLKGKWFEWPEFWQIDPESQVFRSDSKRLRRFTGQSTLFVHHQLTQAGDEGVERLLEWNALMAAKQEPTDVLFQSVFGQTYAELQDELEAYLHGGEFQVKDYNFPPEAMDFVVTEVAVRAQEMRELFVLLQIRNQRTENSTKSLDAVLEKGLASAHLRPLLVEACLSWKRWSDASRIVDLMLADGDVAAETFEAAARFVVMDAVGKLTIDSRLTGEAAAKVRSWSQQALDRSPLSAKANEMRAWAEALGPEVTSSQLDVIKECALRMEHHGATDRCLAALAIGCWRQGDTYRARRVAQHLIDSLYTHEDARELAMTLLARLGDREAEAAVSVKMIP